MPKGEVKKERGECLRGGNSSENFSLGKLNCEHMKPNSCVPISMADIAVEVPL